MLADDQPRPHQRKLSLLRHFSRRTSNETSNTADNHAVYNNVIRPTSRSPWRSPQRSMLPSPPLSPASSKNDSVLDLGRSHSPHLTKDKTYRKDRTITISQRNEVPQIVRERLSRESSLSSTSSTASARVPANAIPTKPFPTSPQSQVRVTAWDVYLPPAQVHALYLGYLPYEMSDKWFIYSEGPDAMGKLKVHFHRSWTGTNIAELFVVMDVKGGGAGKIVGVKWVGGDDVGSGGRMDGSEVKSLIRTTVSSVMGFELEDGK
ncbi:hypothetical protein BDU57DRAFT_516771 [Ampelomyces quisqualis]|uniref:Uncharacterized protein n=1 Tax=Ampelomyces quisqualis TaxID=50730 RepID=A0A6A5QPW6_AMPQU|nr:hypothetical protein BDU57DRAFT_516771 [Ampelomyces quisqualis]